MPGFLACFSFWWWCQVTFPCFRTQAALLPFNCPQGIPSPALLLHFPCVVISGHQPELITVKFLSHFSDWPNFAGNLL